MADGWWPGPGEVGADNSARGRLEETVNAANAVKAVKHRMRF
jgi:hypothetical protein